jgi:hypothetical protein
MADEQDRGAAGHLADRGAQECGLALERVLLRRELGAGAVTRAVEADGRVAEPRREVDERSAGDSGTSKYRLV